MNSKTLVWVYLFVLSVGTIFSLWVPKNEAVAKDSIVIPGDAIRLRILANSDSGSDQALKRKVRDAVNAQIELWVQDLTSKDKAKQVITENLPKIQAIAEKVVHDEGSNQTVNVKFGIVQFPTKLYGQFLYPAGKYQAVLITLGKGLGANWWCVLFPPLCFLDFSNGVAVSNGFEEQKAEAKTKPVDGSSEQNSYDANNAGAKGSDDSVNKQESNGSADQQVADDSSVSTQAVDDSSVSTQAGDDSSVSTQEEDDSSVSTQAGDDSSVSTQEEDDSSVSTQAYEDTNGESTETAQADQEVKASDPQTDQGQAVDEPVKQSSKKAKKQKKASPVYASDDEQPVQVKFFVVELWHKLFD